VPPKRPKVEPIRNATLFEMNKPEHAPQLVTSLSNKDQIQADEFFRRLHLFLKRVKDLTPRRFVVEIRNRAWLDKRLTDLLREHSLALALTDPSNMPRPREVKDGLDLVTADFVYVRWLGDRKGIEALTTTWDKTVIERTDDLKNWAALFRQFVSRNLKVYAYANHHYAGHRPGTVKLFWEEWPARRSPSPEKTIAQQ
jgi:uncharacterized protein YecE (DUF72 family)